MTKVSIIVPVYNASSFLRKSIDSLLTQTLKEIEVVCVDDGSTDDSLAILESYACTDGRVKVLHQENQGQGSAKNKALMVAQGEYIGFVDSDDWVNAEYFEALYNNAKRYDADLAVTCNVKEVYSDRTQQKELGFYKKNKFLNSFNERSLLITSSGIACNKIYRAAFLREKNIQFSPIRSIGEDNFFNILAVLRANFICTTDQATYYYRQRSDSSVHSLSSKDLGVVNIYHDVLEHLSSTEKEIWTDEITKRARSDFLSIYKTFDFDLKDQFVLLVEKKFPSLNFTNDVKQFDTNIIVSLTSYPARIETVHQTVRTLLRQSYKAKEVVLWLAPEQFINKEEDLPQALLALRSTYFKIRWCDDLKSFKKLIPALENYPQHIIVTADDDAYYANDWLERLYKAYLKNPYMVHGHRGHRIAIKSKQVLPYSKWVYDAKNAMPSSLNFLTGVGGILYPAHILHSDIMKKDLFTELCANTDDVWFWAMTILNGAKVNIIDNNLSDLDLIPDTQDVALYHQNVSHGNNDVSLRNILNHYDAILDILLEDNEKAPFVKEGRFHKVVSVCGISIKLRTKNHPHYASPIEQIFSIRNEGAYKVIRLFGLKIRMARKKKIK